jgi:hypothetical protein
MGKRFLLLSFVLGVGLISPVSALAAAGGTNRPFMGTATGTAEGSTATGAGTTEAAGHASLLGAFTASGPFQYVPTGGLPVIPYDLTGAVTFVAANGDELFGTVTGTGTIDTNINVSNGTTVVTITGGTGRFADATGSLDETYTNPFTVVGTDVTGSIIETYNGKISF